jgi:hypothetical protein
LIGSPFNYTGVQGEPFKFLNSLDITRDGIVYFTDSSKKWDRRNYRYEVITCTSSENVLISEYSENFSKPKPKKTCPP